MLTSTDNISRLVENIMMIIIINSYRRTYAQPYTIYTYRRTYASTLYHIHLPEDIHLNLIPYTLTGGHTPQPYTIYTYRRTYASTLKHTHLLLRHTNGHRTSLVFIIDLCSVNSYKRAQWAFVRSFLSCKRHNKVVYNSHS